MSRVYSFTAEILHKKEYLRKRVFLVKAALLSTKYFKYLLGETKCFCTSEVTAFMWEIQDEKNHY